MMRNAFVWNIPRIIGVAGIVLSLSAGFGARDGNAWSLAEAAKPYAGSEVRAICDGYSPCLAYIEMAKKFEEMTDIKVVLEVADLEAVWRQVLADQLTGSEYYDAFPAANNQTAIFAEQGFATNLQDFLDNPTLRDPDIKMEDMVEANFLTGAYYNGELVSVPYHYLPPYSAYRTSLASHPEEQANFKARYGYDLPQPPTTWRQYYDLAEFFTRNAGETLAGEVLEANFYGTIAPFKRHITIYYDYERVLLGMGGEYANHDLEVTIDKGNVGVEALEFMLSLIPLAPPGHTEATWDTEYAEMCNGNVFMVFTWGDTTPFLEIPEDCPSSAGDMTYFVHPGTHLTAPYGQAWMIPKSAKNPNAAWLFIQWLLTEEIQTECMSLGCLAVRSDALRDERWKDPDWPNRQREAIHIWLGDNDKLYMLPNTAHWLAWQEIIIEELSAAGAGYQDAKTTIENIATRMREAAGQS
jgi:multiple sugar transport system substrate-binding protein